MQNYSVSEENYIKKIYQLQKDGTVSTNALAAGLSAKAASVTDMLKKLKSKKLIHYKKYKGFRLTDEGCKIALDIIRRHRLWECFLASKLGFSWSEIHLIAEQLEHVQHPDLANKLSAYLKNPQYDPHGDPIPSNDGKIELLNYPNLLQLSKGQKGRIMHVVDDSPLLEYLNQKRIGLQSLIKITDYYAYDASLEIEAGAGNRFFISEDSAQNIFVRIEL